MLCYATNKRLNNVKYVFNQSNGNAVKNAKKTVDILMNSNGKTIKTSTELIKFFRNVVLEFNQSVTMQLWCYII